MDLTLNPEALRLKDELEKLLNTLKTNRDKVPLKILKTKYKKGYEELCVNICNTASDYVKQVALNGIRIHKEYLDEGIAIIDKSLQESELLKEISKAAFCKQNITEVTNLAFKLRKTILEALDPFYGRHTGLYITPECLENPDMFPEFYCFANGCIWKEEQWVPLAETHPSTLPLTQSA